MSTATAENFAGFNWVFALWDSAALTIIAATEPVFMVLHQFSTALIVVVGFAWCFLIALRVREGIAGVLAGGLLIFALVLPYLMKPAAVQLPSGATVQMVEAQALTLKFVMSAHRIFQSLIEPVLNTHSAAGTIVPAQAAIDDIVGRSADVFAGSDLAQLIRDYNASCVPHTNNLTGPERATKIEALHSIGLLGGGGLGIPDQEISLISQARTALSASWTFVSGGWATYFLGGGEARKGLERVLDQRAMQTRREEGLRMLEHVGPFMGGRYKLPAQDFWAAKFSGKSEAQPTYLPISLIPSQKRVVVAPAEFEEIHFQPSSCVEAYRVAQLGAEQAYQALRESGEVIAGGQRVSAEVGAVSTAVAWQRFMARSLQHTTDLSAEGSEVAGGILASAQMFKNFKGWLDLQTLLPGYVILAAWVFWIVLLLAPLFLLLVPLRGGQIIAQWLALLLLPVVGVMVAQIVNFGASMVMAAVAVGQAGAASGWTGAGADYDALRGMMTGLATGVLGFATWITGSMLGVSLSGLTGSLSGAVATASEAGAFVSKAVGMAMLVGRLGRMGGAANVSRRSPGSESGGQTASRNSAGVAGTSRAPSPTRIVMTQFTPAGSRNRRLGGANAKGSQSLNPPKKPTPPTTPSI
ncbi:hypothetical protein C1170_06220 [Stutzerimonas frequens]|uniref:Conjugal transfer protein TraG n=1 Tax=Stutzerimonas frequens TaxID=2968969 RepID=A0ABX6XYB8_9GAMM|nr:hypothetical protein [Stutzerimonas frequens]MCQ4302710.1 hypothetical protein [Stutzerimonas frequens]PNF52528.1 hypothetical protein C1170_06220 [Stutzerimonas frequens]QPT19008.1 hypothetical protein I6G34_06520 [Stutzerimonas frequens]